MTSVGPSSEFRVRLAVRQIVSWLVAGDYAAIERKSKGVRLSADDLRFAIKEYGAKLTMPPNHAFDDFEIMEVDRSVTKHPTWAVTFFLWTSEGVSDLTLECRLIDVGHIELAYETDDLHVL